MAKKESKQKKMNVRVFFNDTATTEIYTLSLHDALPIYQHPIHIKNHPFDHLFLI